MFTIGYPTQAVTHCANKQVPMTVKHDSPEQQALIGKLTIVNIVLIDLSVTIIEQTMNANHQYTTFIINETCNRAIRRIKLFDFSIRCSVSNRTAMSGFPEVAFLKGRLWHSLVPTLYAGWQYPDGTVHIPPFLRASGFRLPG